MRKGKTSTRERKIRRLLEKGAEHLVPLKHGEFKCPNCKGVATVIRTGDIVYAECHACGIYGDERISKWKRW